jgi:glycosyltransferase involved in cell wall biosynthesis
MRILFVGRNAKIGGGTTFRLNIARGLRKRGHEIWLAAQPGEVLPRYREIGVHYVWTPPAPWGGPWIERAIRKNNIDLVHASNTTPGRAAEWACNRTGTPLVMTVHGLLPRRDAHHSCWTKTLKIMTFEEMAVKRLSEHVGMIDMAKVELLRRPIEHRPQFPTEAGPFRIVGVGRMSKRKGKNALNQIEAFAKFQEAVPESTLQLLGDGSIIGEVRRAARDYNRRVRREAVSVLGAVPNPVPIMGKAHIVIGASYCALESIMQGVAVVGAGFWGYGIIDQENLRDAMAWNFGDVGGTWEMTAENFLESMRFLHRAWTENRERERYWRLDRLIEDEHSLDNVAGRIEEIYRQVLSGTTSPATLAAAC